MVCDRCITAVGETLQQIDDLDVVAVELGIAKLQKPATKTQLDLIEKSLSELGFELLRDKTSKLIAHLKSVVINEIHHNKNQMKDSDTFSSFLAKKMGYDYSYLNQMFSSREGKTIGKYIVEQKIEKVKELLGYDELTLGEIAWRMNYSSVQYLSAQFTKQTGHTPTEFKKLNDKQRQSLDSI